MKSKKVKCSLLLCAMLLVTTASFAQRSGEEAIERILREKPEKPAVEKPDKQVVEKPDRDIQRDIENAAKDGLQRDINNYREHGNVPSITHEDGNSNNRSNSNEVEKHNEPDEDRIFYDPMENSYPNIQTIEGPQ